MANNKDNAKYGKARQVRDAAKVRNARADGIKETKDKNGVFRLGAGIKAGDAAVARERGLATPAKKAGKKPKAAPKAAAKATGTPKKGGGGAKPNPLTPVANRKKRVAQAARELGL